MMSMMVMMVIGDDGDGDDDEYDDDEYDGDECRCWSMPTVLLMFCDDV